MGPYGPLRFRGGGTHGWFWVFGGITMVLFWVVLLLAVVLIVRAISSRGRWAARPGVSHTMPAPPPGGVPGTSASSAEQILAERLARGDIDVDDYHRRLAALHEGTVPPPPTSPPPQA